MVQVGKLTTVDLPRCSLFKRYPVRIVACLRYQITDTQRVQNTIEAVKFSETEKALNTLTTDLTLELCLSP